MFASILQLKKFNLYSGEEHPYMEWSHPHHRQTMSDPGARAAFSLRSIHTNAAVLGLDDLYYCDKYSMTTSDIYKLLIVSKVMSLLNSSRAVQSLLGNKIPDTSLTIVQQVSILMTTNSFNKKKKYLRETKLPPLLSIIRGNCYIYPFG